MSLWLPRTIILARNHNIPRIIARNARANGRLILLLHHTNLTASHISLRGFQSTQPSAAPLESLNTVDVSPPKSGPPTPKERPKPLATRVWKKVKHEVAHYWHGSKLLVSEVRISSRLQWKILQGDTLTRRERRQVRSRPYLTR